MNRSSFTRFIIYLGIVLVLLAVGGAVTSGSVRAVAPAAPPDFAVPTWMKDAVVYYIFPERFRNGNTANDPPGTVGWLSAPTASNYMGGDLQGVIDKINSGYFADLGINTIYSTPLFKATSNHAYNTGDYYNIDPRFGNNALFDTLIATANSHGIKIILDGVWNHAGDDSKYMDAYNQWTDVGACESASSVYRSWFTTGSQGTCPDGWHWNGWAGYSSIPEFAEVPAVKAFFFNGGSPQSPGGVGVAQYWLAKGISGWRFDVAFDITHQWWQEVRPKVKGPYPQAALIGEVWQCDAGSGSPSFLQGDQLDANMNYCLRDMMLNWANGGSPSGFDNSYNSLRNLIPSSAWYAMMNLVGGHDTVRVLDQLGSNKQREKLIAILQMTLPGMPTVYYGDEVGLPGGNDPDDRRAYPWADMGGSPDTNMYAHYKTVISIRKTNSALRGGTLNTLLVNDSLNLYSFIRTDASQKIVVILNNGGSNRSAVVNVSAYLANGVVVTDLLNGNAQYVVSGGNLTVPVNSLWGAILRDCPTCPTPTPAPPTATSTPPPGTVAVTFRVSATTVAGDSIWVVGDIAALGAWAPENGLLLTQSGSIWSGTANLPANTVVLYKYVKKNGSTITWEWDGDPNRSFTTPASGAVTRNEVWGTQATATPAASTATRTPTRTFTPAGPTATRTRTPTPGGATATRTRTPTTGPTATRTNTPIGPTPTSVAINPAAWYRVVNQNSSKCVDASNGGTANDTHVQQWACAVTNAQNWNFTPTDSGYYWVGTRNLSSQVWDVSGILLTDGAVIHLWAWSNGGNQQWLPVAMGGGFYKFVARHSAKCLDVPGSSTADGIQLQQYTCNGTAAQSFSLTQVP